jgi:hypothetical protein
MHDYYYRDDQETAEVIIQAVGKSLSVRVYDDEQNALVYLPIEEIDSLIEGLKKAKQKIITYQTLSR